MEEKQTEEMKPSNKLSKRAWTWIVIGVVIIVLIAVAWSIKRYNEYRSGHSKFVSTDATFSLDYPRTWDVQMGNRGAIEATFVNTPLKQSAGQDAYVHVAKGVLGGSTVEQAYNDAMQKYAKLFAKMNVVSQGDIKIDGVPGKTVVFNGILGGKTIGYAIVVFVKEGTVYVMTASGPADDYKIVQDELNNMISSWKFIKGNVSEEKNTVQSGSMPTDNTKTPSDLSSGSMPSGGVLPSGSVKTTPAISGNVISSTGVAK